MPGIERVPLPVRMVLSFVMLGVGLVAIDHVILKTPFTVWSVLVVAVVAALVEAAFRVGGRVWRRLVGD